MTKEKIQKLPNIKSNPNACVGCFAYLELKNNCLMQTDPDMAFRYFAPLHNWSRPTECSLLPPLKPRRRKKKK